MPDINWQKLMPNHILLVRGEDKIIVTLNTQKERNPGEVKGKTTFSGTVSNLSSGQIPQTLQPQTTPTQSYSPPSPPVPAGKTLNSR